MPNLRRFLARFVLCDNQMTIILEIIFLLQKIKYAHLMINNTCCLVISRINYF